MIKSNPNDILEFSKNFLYYKYNLRGKGYLMFSKPRKPVSLQILEALKKRKVLSVEEQSTYKRLSSGYSGEKRFANLLKSEFHNPAIPLFDLNLTVNGSECQLDCILIFQNELLLLDIKNIQGDFFIKNDSLHFVKETKEIQNPLHQLKRAEILLMEFLTQQQIPLKIKSYLIFVHPEFHVYQAPHHLPIIYPGQIHRFISGLHHYPYELQKRHQIYAQRLMNAHLPISKYEQLPIYEYQQLRKGIFCHHCDYFMVIGNSSRQLTCKKCGKGEPVDSAIIRSVTEFDLLFPDEKITVERVNHWCNQIIPKSSIKRVFSKTLKIKGYGKGSYYIF